MSKVINGTTFNDSTPERVCDIINYYMHKGKRVRFFYGDTETGRDWCETYDVLGYIGRSCGTSQIPILLPKILSMFGGSILDHCIVKITIDKEVKYVHPKYHLPLEQRGNQIFNNETNEVFMNCDSEEIAKRHLDYYKGTRNNY